MKFERSAVFRELSIDSEKVSISSAFFRAISKEQQHQQQQQQQQQQLASFFFLELVLALEILERRSRDKNFSRFSSSIFSIRPPPSNKRKRDSRRWYIYRYQWEMGIWRDMGVIA